MGGIIGAVGAFFAAFTSYRWDLKRRQPRQEIEAIETADKLMECLTKGISGLYRTWNESDGFRNLTHASTALNDLVLEIERIGTIAHGKSEPVKQLAFSIRDQIIAIRHDFTLEFRGSPQKLLDVDTEAVANEMVAIVLSRLAQSQQDVRDIKRDLMNHIVN